MVKKSTVFLASLIFFSLLPVFVFAQCPFPDTQIIPCGGGECPCTLCLFFEMISRIIRFFLTTIVPVVAVLMVVLAGAMMVSAYAGSSGPELISRAKKLLGAIVIGLLIVYTAWLLINTFLQAIGVAKWTGLQNWWEIDCQTAAPPIPVITCGNGGVDLGEQCDPPITSMTLCGLLPGFESTTGMASCDLNCQWNTSNCVPTQPPPKTYCGDGKVQSPNDDGINEKCEPFVTPEVACSSLPGWSGAAGQATCTDMCDFNDSACTRCGNGVIDSLLGEVCDSPNFGGKTCADFGRLPGNLQCTNNCTVIDPSQCGTTAVCGDGIVQKPNVAGQTEKCDCGLGSGTVCTPAQLDNQTCQSQGFLGGGTLECTGQCEFYTGHCIAKCANGCDPAGGGTISCSSVLAGTIGDAVCLPKCELDTKACTKCGNNVIDPGEACDGTAIGSKTCKDFGLAPGTLKCLAGSNCQKFDTGGCGPVLPPSVGDKLCNCIHPGCQALTQKAAIETKVDGTWVALWGWWSFSKINSNTINPDGTKNINASCQDGWFGTGPAGSDPWKNITEFANDSRTANGTYIGFGGACSGCYVIFEVISHLFIIIE